MNRIKVLSIFITLLTVSPIYGINAYVKEMKKRESTLKVISEENIKFGERPDVQDALKCPLAGSQTYVLSENHNGQVKYTLLSKRIHPWKERLYAFKARKDMTQLNLLLEEIEKACDQFNILDD
jgi:hypothetical protein